LPDGRSLVTPEDAGNYITKLPKVEHSAPEWQAAMEALILVATRGGPTMLARIGVMTALNRHVVREFNPDRKDTHWGKRKAEAGRITRATASSAGNSQLNHLIDRRSLGRHRDACFPSTKLTSTPFLTDFANRSTSQFVILTQPCDSDLLTRDGSAVP
jgi:hypothetical protein